jgi:hypothetical protein
LCSAQRTWQEQSAGNKQTAISIGMVSLKLPGLCCRVDKRVRGLHGLLPLLQLLLLLLAATCSQNSPQETPARLGAPVLT